MAKQLDYLKIGNKIKEIRQQKGITREKLSEKIGISTMYLGQLERGERRGGINNYVEIANILEVSLDYLFLDEVHTVEILNNQVMREMKEVLSTLDNNQKTLFLNISMDIAKRLKENKTNN